MSCRSELATVQEEYVKVCGEKEELVMELEQRKKESMESKEEIEKVFKKLLQKRNTISR